jgi:N-acetylglucosaminyldiphosphoundecaprenol N-acetyl-beta-D-mannosaminyltransferase
MSSDPALYAPAPLAERRRARRVAFRQARRASERTRLLGEWVDLLRPEEVMQLIERRIAERRRTVIANHNLHSLYLVRRDPGMRAFYDRAELVEVDSRPMVAVARALGGRSRAFHRCTYLDWREHFWSLASRNGWRVQYVGGAPGVAAEAARRLSARYPGAVIDVLDGYFDATRTGPANVAVIGRVRAFDPHVLFVGMGMPRQERWISENLEALPPAVILSVGAAFDYEAGVQAAAPRWMGRAGLEWAYRLVRDPRRLWRRYLVEPWALLPALAGDVVAALRGRQ